MVSLLRRYSGLFISLLCLIPYAGSAQTSTQELDTLDGMINHPSSKNIFTERAFNKFIYQDQQAIGGSTIREGKVVGSNATVDEKSLTLNVGTDIKYVGRSGFTLQGTLKGQSEEGFVNVFSGGDFSKTLGGGGGILWFLPQSFNFYTEQARERLHSRLRKERNEQEGKRFPDFGLTDTPNKLKWATPVLPVQESVWQAKYIPRLQALAVASRKLAAATLAYAIDSTAHKLTQAETKAGRWEYPAVRKAEAAYQNADSAATILLPANWPYLNGDKRRAWLDDRVDAAGIISNNSLTTKWLSEQWGGYNEAARQKRLRHYDSLQMKTSWSFRYRQWLSLTALSNVAIQPVFDAGKPTEGYKRDFHDYYFDGKLAYNGLWISPIYKQYVSAGIGLSTMRRFEQGKRRTYQYTSWQANGTDSVQVVKQNSLYPTIPTNPHFSTWQVQYSFYSTQRRFGIDITAQGQYSRSYTARHTLTFGIFVPIQAAGTTLLFMPQVRWANANKPDPFTLGLNLSASIPGFVTKDKTE